MNNSMSNINCMTEPDNQEQTSGKLWASLLLTDGAKIEAAEVVP